MNPSPKIEDLVMQVELLRREVRRLRRARQPQTFRPSTPPEDLIPMEDRPALFAALKAKLA